MTAMEAKLELAAYVVAVLGLGGMFASQLSSRHPRGDTPDEKAKYAKKAGRGVLIIGVATVILFIALLSASGATISSSQYLKYQSYVKSKFTR